MHNHFYWGVDYYPEHWPETRWEEDARLMRAAGFNVVRLAEFAWSLLEPSDGEFEFAWLDNAVEVLANEGLEIILSTPSASVPPWLFHAHPDIAIVDADGTPRTYGSRRDATPASATYRDYAVRVATRMAQHYADNPHVIGWQIDNEFGDRDYSDNARRAFQVWLEGRYGTLEALNTTWGTRFWSHVYTTWQEIPVPRSTSHTLHNPSLHLDYDRFLSDCYVDFQQAQIDVIRSVVPAEHFITHNFQGFTYPDLNLTDLASPLDFVSWDNYPSAFWRDNTHAVPADVALNHASMWGLKSQNFWVMEQQSGASGWQTIGPTPKAGQVALWTWQAVAHGANGIVFFRWRTNPYGAEQNWHGILHTDGQPNRRYYEILEMGQQIRQLAEQIATTEPVYDLAILHDYDTRFSFQIQPDNPHFSYEEHVADYYRVLHAQGLTPAVLPTSATWEDKPLVIVPALRLVDEELAGRFRAYVEAGGVLVLTVRSGTRDLHNAIVKSPFPGLLTDLCGATVSEYDSICDGSLLPVIFQDLVTPECQSGHQPSYQSSHQSSHQPEKHAHARVWCDVLDAKEAQVLATYASGAYDGMPAVTLHQVGRGTVIYAGSVGDDAFVTSVLAQALNLANIQPILDTSNLPMVEVAHRRGAEGVLTFVMNHSPQQVDVDLHDAAYNLLNHTIHQQKIVLGTYDVALLQRQPAAVIG
jgi:beta-galactosidase